MLFLSYSSLPEVPDLNLELPQWFLGAVIQVCIYLLYFIIHRFISVVISNTNESLMLVSVESFQEHLCFLNFKDMCLYCQSILWDSCN